MSLSPSTVVSQSFPIDSSLTRILGGTAFKWEAKKLTGFTKWWETTNWAAKLRDNLAKDVQGRSNISPPRWDSKLRTATHWAQFGQGAKVSSGEPFIYCLGCNGTLQHPSAFNVGTTHMKSHLSLGKCRADTGQRKEDIASMFGRVII